MGVKCKISKLAGFFLVGAVIGLLLLIITFVPIFEISFQNKIYPKVLIADISFGGQTQQEVENYFNRQNASFANLAFTFIYEDKQSFSTNKIATLSGQELQVGFDSHLLATQAYLIGRTGNLATAFLQQLNQTNLSPSFTYNQDRLSAFLAKKANQINIPAQDALFNFDAGRVIAFQPSAEGLALDQQKAIGDFNQLISPPRAGTIYLAAVPVEPKVKTEQANSLGIKEFIAGGKSFFRGSIANRIYNITLAASHLNGLLIAPGEIFSFNNSLGEVSTKTGYKQAYVIKEKKTVLDDGGGVCQVSTTFFRTALNAGLPIEERHAHAYRVGYYEQGGFGPGLDATVYAPTVDLKIKNDYSSYILIQTNVNPADNQLNIDFYGTSDGRVSTISKVRISNETKPPDDLYQDDPTLPKGQIKQIDFAAWGAKTAFDYRVVRGMTVLQERTFTSNFQPWQAIFLRGTKE